MSATWLRFGAVTAVLLLSLNIWMMLPARNVQERQGSSASISTPSVVHSESVTDDEAGYTIVINSFRREHCLKEALNHWLTCFPTEIVIVWADPENDPPDYISDYDNVKVQRYPDTNITYRFHPAPFKTQAVFSVDDDCLYSCAVMDAAFKEFNKDPYNSMVGFAPRKLYPSGGYYNSDTNFNGMYNTIFATKGAFLHHRFYKLYWDSNLDWIRHQIDKNITAEDILMSAIFAREVKSTPLVVSVTNGDRRVLRCGGDLVSKNGWPSVEQRRKVLTSAIYDAMGDRDSGEQCPRHSCICKCCGTSSNDCSCLLPHETEKENFTERRCGFPFRFENSGNFLNGTTGVVEYDPRRCIRDEKKFYKQGCIYGIFI